MLMLGMAVLSTLVISLLMSITGRGGGNFYVPVLVACGLPMLQAATSAQCIMLCTAVAAALVFQKNRMIDWKLAMVIDPPTDVMALLGGYYAHFLPGGSLYLLACLYYLAFSCCNLQGTNGIPARNGWASGVESSASKSTR
jgi:uncharacterized membrane protein YfcA